MRALLTVGLSASQVESLRIRLTARGWQVCSAGGWTQVFLRLRERAYSAVLCEADLPDGDWRDALDELQLCTDPPPLVVTSKLLDAHLWTEVLDAGGHDALAYPFEPDELIRVLDSAARRRPPGTVGQGTHGQAASGR